ncbi:MAG TPA: tautomerase family protein [Mycobacterium sp.]
MPLVQVDLDRHLYDSHHAEISKAIHAAEIEALGMQEDDLFQVFTPHDAGELKFDPGYNGVDRQQLVLVRLTMVHMYSVETKRALYAAVRDKLGGCGVRPEDILICIVENGFEDWYAGKL